MIHKSISLKATNPQNYYTLAITYNNMGPVEVKQSTSGMGFSRDSVDICN